MFPLLFTRRLTIVVATALSLNVTINLQALTILTGPSVATAANAPLAGVLTLTTDDPSRVSVSVSDGTNTWQRNFYDYATNHSIPLLGFKSDRTNLIAVTVHDKFRNAVTAADPLEFITDPLPSDFPPSLLITNQPAKMEPGYTLLRIVNRNTYRAYLTVVDNAGEVVWYSRVTSTSDVRQLENGDLFIPLTRSFVEINMLGNTVRTWNVPSGLNINLHDGVPTPHGTILYLNDASKVVSDFPTSATDPDAPLQTTNVLYNKVVEISATDSKLLNTWSPIDVLDPRRLTYLTFQIRNWNLGWDIEHANALIEDPRDDTLIVSMRQQNAVIKFFRDTGQIKWILGPHENWGPEFQQYLLTPVGTPFAWQYGQHAPIITPQGTLLVYDNGNFRASPFDPFVPDEDNYTRAVEYDIDETNMTVSQVWEYGSSIAEPIFTGQVGNADWLPQTGNVLINFGFIWYINGVRPSPFSTNASMIRIKEVTHEPNPEVVFDLAFFDYANTNSNYLGCWTYRCHRIPDLYGHLATPITDLTVRFEEGIPRLEFSADETKTYAIEASTDLSDWREIGNASPEAEAGNFNFEDHDTLAARARFYRVVSQ